MSCGNVVGSNRVARPKRLAGEAYTVMSYRRAITRACEVAEIPSWHPHQLRHTAATVLARQFGRDQVRAALGHRSLQVTEGYIERDVRAATEVLRKVG